MTFRKLLISFGSIGALLALSTPLSAASADDATTPSATVAADSSTRTTAFTGSAPRKGDFPLGPAALVLSAVAMLSVSQRRRPLS
ncbi:hypothetical protein [Parvularcula sp. LCG005]|uniref:hypothetical protein n=1 Tax=Parvularcula sp. LCG005 TaxID=3078805 RepID=UPI00294386EF|nr:hypothetical protein [Parvularcula sp. LCG005]WOI53424.1 hypothetical protein RUI03_00170 [Parvularcula sp. LCG005]